MASVLACNGTGSGFLSKTVDRAGLLLIQDLAARLQAVELAGGSCCLYMPTINGRSSWITSGRDVLGWYDSLEEGRSQWGYAGHDSHYLTPQGTLNYVNIGTLPLIKNNHRNVIFSDASGCGTTCYEAGDSWSASTSHQIITTLAPLSANPSGGTAQISWDTESGRLCTLVKASVPPYQQGFYDGVLEQQVARANTTTTAVYSWRLDGSTLLGHIGRDGVEESRIYVPRSIGGRVSFMGRYTPFAGSWCGMMGNAYFIMYCSSIDPNILTSARNMSRYFFSTP